MKQPIRVFYSPLGQRFYASQYYKRMSDKTVVITGAKFDVTDDIAKAVIEFDLEFTSLRNSPTPPP